MDTPDAIRQSTIETTPDELYNNQPSRQPQMKYTAINHRDIPRCTMQQSTIETSPDAQYNNQRRLLQMKSDMRSRWCSSDTSTDRVIRWKRKD